MKGLGNENASGVRHHFTRPRFVLRAWEQGDFRFFVPFHDFNLDFDFDFNDTHGLYWRSLQHSGFVDRKSRKGSQHDWRRLSGLLLDLFTGQYIDRAKRHGSLRSGRDRSDFENDHGLELRHLAFSDRRVLGPSPKRQRKRKSKRGFLGG